MSALTYTKLVKISTIRPREGAPNRLNWWMSTGTNATTLMPTPMSTEMSDFSSMGPSDDERWSILQVEVSSRILLRDENRVRHGLWPKARVDEADMVMRTSLRNTRVRRTGRL